MELALLKVEIEYTGDVTEVNEYLLEIDGIESVVAPTFYIEGTATLQIEYSLSTTSEKDILSALEAYDSVSSVSSVN